MLFLFFQVLAALSTLHDFDESSTFEKIGMAADVFTDLAPAGGMKLGDGVSY